MSIANPMQTDGFEFVEYAAPDPGLLRRLFENMGCLPWRGIARIEPRTAGRHLEACLVGASDRGGKEIEALRWRCSAVELRRGAII